MFPMMPFTLKEARPGPPPQPPLMAVLKEKRPSVQAQIRRPLASCPVHWRHVAEPYSTGGRGGHTRYRHQEVCFRAHQQRGCFHGHSENQDPRRTVRTDTQPHGTRPRGTGATPRADAPCFRAAGSPEGPAETNVKPACGDSTSQGAGPRSPRRTGSRSRQTHRRHGEHTTQDKDPRGGPGQSALRQTAEGPGGRAPHSTPAAQEGQDEGPTRGRQRSREAEKRYLIHAQASSKTEEKLVFRTKTSPGRIQGSIPAHTPCSEKERI